MQNTMQINNEVTVGPQPSADEINKLSQQGFKTVVNFRTEGEEDQPLSPQDEAEKVKAAGMEYLHVPVSMKAMGPEKVDEFRANFSDLPKPVFAHCKGGKRAGAMVMMHVSCEHGMTGEQTLQKAQEMGFQCDQPELVEFVKNYVDKNTKKS